MMREKYHILSVDDDSRLRQLLSDYLVTHGYYINTVESASSAQQLLELFTFDLMILDVMMPQENGIDFMYQLKNHSHKNFDTPILMLTAKAEGEDRIEGLEKGAEDYLVKPFEPKELLLRIENLLKRSHKFNQDVKQSDIFYFGNFSFIKNTKTLYCDNKFVFLNEVEKKLLIFFMENPNVTHTRQDLLKVLEANNVRTADVIISRLRQKIEDNTRSAQHLQTVRGKGYAFIIH